MKRILTIMLAAMAVAVTATGCGKQPADKIQDNPQMEGVKAEEPHNQDISRPAEGTSIILSTTTSTQDSGLLDYLLPVFTSETGVEVKVISVGTGKAIQMGKDGEADVLLVHSTPDEIAFVAEGHSPARHDVMYNDFVLVGPPADPAAVRADYPADAAGAFKAIAESGQTFISRADESGTHKKELKLWEAAGIVAGGEWYVEAGQGMGPVLTMASEKQAYTLSDRATYLSMLDDLELEIVAEGDDSMFNQYGVLTVDPAKNENINAEGALLFQNWILSDKTQKLIAEFGQDEYGQSLFVPDAE